MKTVFKKMLSLVLVAILLVSAVPFQASATEIENGAELLGVELITPITPSDSPSEEKEEDEVYYIHLNTYGDGYHDKVAVVNGVIPELPQPENTADKAFLYWFQTETGDKLVSGEEYKYERDIYAMAQWQDIPMSDEEKEDAVYTLTLDSNTGNASKQYQISVRYGWEIGNDLYDYEPEYAGHEFMGWYLNGKPIDHTTKWEIEGDATAYAKWDTVTEYDVTMKIYLNENTKSVAKAVNMEAYAGDGKITYAEAEKAVRKYYEEKYDDDDMDIEGLFTRSTWNGGKYDLDDAKKSITVKDDDDTIIYVMVRDAQEIGESDYVLKIYANGNTKSVAKAVNMKSYIDDGKITYSEVEKVVRRYFEEKYNDDDMDIDGLFVKSTWNGGDYDMDDAKNTISVGDDGITIYVMVRDAKRISSGTADSSNPKTGDSIFVAVTVMTLSALALVYVFDKKRAVK